MVNIQRVAVVTGASSGIGLEAARTLASQGWRVIAVGRNPERCAMAQAELRTGAGGSDVTMLQADLSLMKNAARLADDIAALTDRIDLLANNAGGMTRSQEMTAEGLEACFAANHLGPFLLTLRLLPLLRKAASHSPRGSVRIINTSSDGSEMIPGLNFDDLENRENFSPGLAYCSGKLANVMFAKGLALRLSGDGILAFSFHPGTVESNFKAHVPDSTRQYIDTLDAIDSTQGADTLAWLANADPAELTNGGYYYMRKLRAANPQAEDQAAIEQLWSASEALVRRGGESLLL